MPVSTTAASHLDEAPITDGTPTQVSLRASVSVPSGSSDSSDRPSDRDVATHLRTAFLRRVAHDIASPAGVAMTVLDELASTPNPRPELLAMARRSLRRLMRLSDQLAMVAELESGGASADDGDIDLRSVTQKAVEDAVAVDGRRDVVASSALPDAAVWTKGDGKQLGSVIREIVGNALKLATSRVEVTLSVDGDRLVLRVEDDGPGFSEESTATFGTRFVPKSAMRGLGLSLSMATEIVGALGGSVSRDRSRLPPGRRGTPGAAVVVSLPAAHG